MTRPQIRVLVVEDDVVDRMACRRALARHPDYEFLLLEADTGAEGLRLARSQPLDCILLDYRLPDLDGLEFLAEFCAEAGEAPVPVVKLTGADNSAIAVEAMKRGARDYLVKDRERQYLELLPAVIQRVLHQQRLLREKRQAEAKYRTLVEQIPAITYIAELGEARNYLYVNPRITALGFSSEEWLADPEIHRSQIHPDDRARVLAAIDKSRLTGDPLECEYRLRSRSGEVLWFRDQAGVVRDEAEQPLFLQGVLTDITANKRVEQELREHRRDLKKLVEKRTAALIAINEHLHREILERRRAEEESKRYAEEVRDLYDNAPCGYHSLDRDGTFIQINDTELAWLGYRRDEVVGKMKFADLLTAEGVEAFRENFPRFREQGSVRDLEYELVRKDGSVMPVLLNAVAIYDSDGTYLKSRGTIFDITERRRAEEVRQSHELLRRLAAHGELIKEEERKRIAREIHDELGQKLTALQLEASMLHAHFAHARLPLADKTGSMMELIDDTIESVRTIATALRPAVLDLGLAAAIEWQVQDFETRCGIGCELVLDQEEIILDDSRATAVFRILQESLTNISRHARATSVKITLTTENDTLSMTVEDNGIGITPGNLKKSTSFGLVGMRERALMLGGGLSIDSGPGKGTRLTISIPMEEGTAAS